MIVSQIRRFTLLALLLLLSACSSNSSNGPKLTITFPSAASMKAMSKPATSNKSFNWDLACYIVNVTGPGITETLKNSCEIPTGKFKGSVAPGGSITLEIDRGANRRLEVFAFLRASVGEPCPALDSGFGSLSRLKISTVGLKENISIESNEVSVDVNLAFPSVADIVATKYGLPASCLPKVDPDSFARITPARIHFAGSGLIMDQSISSLPSDFKAQGSTLMIRANIRRN